MTVLMSATLLLSALTFVLCLAAVLLVVKTKPAAQATLLDNVRSSPGTPPHPVGGTVSPYHNNDSWRWIQ